MMRLVLPVALLLSAFAFSQTNAPNLSIKPVAEIEKLENAKFESRKDSVLSKIKAYSYSTYRCRISIDSISLFGFFYGDSLLDGKSQINEYSYEIWVQVEDLRVAKYIVFIRDDSVTKYVMDKRADVTNDPKLIFMNNRLELARVKSDSIRNFMSDNEDRKFISDKVAIEKNVIGYLNKVYKVISLDSLALSDFTYDDSLPEYWNKINQYEYDAWVVYDSNLAKKIKLFAENGKIVKFELVHDTDHSDDKINQMQENLDQLAILREDRMDQLAFLRESRKFNSGKPAALQLATKCLKEYANDPSSVKIAKIYLHSATASGNVMYHVVYRARNGFGAIVLGAQAVTVKGSKCIDVSKIDANGV